MSKQLELNVGGTKLWLNHEEWKLQQNWYAMQDWIFGQVMMQGCAADDPALLKAAYDKFGIKMPEPTPSNIIIVQS
jgi:hypothetical protein